MKNAYAIILVGVAAMGLGTLAVASTIADKAAYKAARDSASAQYKVARDKCNVLTGNPKDVCVEEAKAARTRSNATAEAEYKNTPRALASAHKAIADADYDVARTKCDSKTGNEKDVCIKEAKAVNVATKADATADRKVMSAHIDAMDDKRDANYKVAIEKCDAYAGALKENCVVDAKRQFAK